MEQIIYGKNPVLEALEAGNPINKIYISIKAKHPVEHRIIQLARQNKIPVREIDRKKMNSIVGSGNHQGIAALLQEMAYSELSDIFERAKEKGEAVLLAILDEIQDPHNLGAIIRSAEAFGFHGIIIPKDRAVGLTQTVAKTSAGAVAHIPVVRVNNLARTIDELKESGLWITGAEHTADQSFIMADLNRPLGIVIGSEGKGIRRLIKTKCDFLIRIPMHGQVNSLNASVAAALLFFEARKQRNKL